MGIDRLHFARAVLYRCNFQRHHAYEKCLVAVMAGEGSAAHWNPLDTTLFLPGASAYNSFGAGGKEHVWNYLNAEQGIAATALTLLQPNMEPWTKLLRERGHNASELAMGFSECPWGGVGDTLPLRLVQQWDRSYMGYVEARRVLVQGPGRWPYRGNGAPRR